MTLESLQYVYAAYKFGSYKEAAFALSVSYSVVAKQVSRVEEELGVKLFERASKSKEMNLTLAGEVLIGEIKTIIKAYHRAEVFYPSVEYEKDQVSVNCGFHFLMSGKNPLADCL